MKGYGIFARVRYIDPKTGAAKWTHIRNTDMAHRYDAVKWWNETGIKYGPKSPEVRAWMLDPNNYELHPYWVNRSAGAKLDVTYLE